MAIALYNTLTRKVETFVPLAEGEAGMYTCGPTVYDYFHIGNARTFVMSDVLRRYLIYRGYKVKFVMNITDVDDRIIARANEEGVPPSEVAARYTEAFFQDVAALAVLPADAHPRATENMDGIISHITRLVAADMAYVVDGDVFFRVGAFPKYGALSGKKVDELLAGARVETDPRKDHPCDFALWKSAKPGEPSWDSPWGKGRPGWHIECSVMSMKHLGESFDIHAGGNDLIFPHHENEIAQSEALTSKPLAGYWLHFGFLNIDNEKMSKSLGNFMTARDILRRRSAETIRFFYLQTHYRGPLNFSDEGLDASEKGLQRLQTLYDALEEHADGGGDLDVESYEKRFIESVDHDLNTPAGFGVIFDLVREANSLLHGGGLSAASRGAAAGFLRRTAGEVFGVLRAKDASSDGEDEFAALMRLLMETRAKARAAKQWELADSIRDGLKDLGLILEDGKEGTAWKRIGGQRD